MRKRWTNAEKKKSERIDVIAALLLDGGATAHSRLKIPVNGIDQHSTCYIPKQSNEAKLIRATSLSLWEEAPMQHKHAFEAVDRTFRDLTGLDRPFGGVVVVMGGDLDRCCQ